MRLPGGGRVPPVFFSGMQMPYRFLGGLQCGLINHGLSVVIRYPAFPEWKGGSALGYCCTRPDINEENLR